MRHLRLNGLGATPSLIFNLCKNRISPGSFLPFFLYLTHFLSRHYSRNSRQAAGAEAEKGEGNLSLRFLNNTWWSVTFSHMQIPNPIVNLWASQPEGCEVLSGCLWCFVLVIAQSFRKFNLFQCHCQSIVASFLFSNSIFSFTFLLSFFRFRLYFFLFACRGAVTNFCHLLLLLPCFVLVCKKGLTHVALPAELCEKLTGFGTDCTRDRWEVFL